MQPIMSNKIKSTKWDVDKPFRRIVEEEGRQSRYYERKRWETEGITSAKKNFDSHEASILPFDLIASKILARLPAKTVGRFRRVCKQWREVTYEPWFISLHLEQSKKNPVLLIAPLYRGKQTDISIYKYNIDENINRSMKTAHLTFKQEFRETLETLDTPLHAYGLMLLGSPSSLVVCNPCTREFIKLPDGHPKTTTNNPFCSVLLSPIFQLNERAEQPALSYASSSNSYKVVQYFYRHRYCGVNEGVGFNVGLEILTLGGKKEKEGLRWEVAREDAPYPIGSFARPKAVGETVYFRISNSLHRSTPKDFLSYNLKDEKYRVVDFPLRYKFGLKATKVSDLEGEACFTCIKDKSVIDIWILSSEDYTLYRRFTLQLLPLYVHLFEPIAVRNGKLLVHLDDGIRRLDYYDPETGCFENVALIANDVIYYEKQKSVEHSIVRVLFS